MKNNYKLLARYCIISVFVCNSATAAEDKEKRLDGGSAGDVRIMQVLNFEELEKVDWNPVEPLPLEATKAIAIARKFCKDNLKGKVSDVVRELRLRSININRKWRWYWQVIFEALENKSIKTWNPITIPVSLGGTILVQLEKN